MNVTGVLEQMAQSNGQMIGSIPSRNMPQQQMQQMQQMQQQQRKPKGKKKKKKLMLGQQPLKVQNKIIMCLKK